MNILIILTLLYFLPFTVALLRGHRSTWAILALNVLLGWTVFGWIGAFVWSLTYNTYHNYPTRLT